MQVAFESQYLKRQCHAKTLSVAVDHSGRALSLGVIQSSRSWSENLAWPVLLLLEGLFRLT